MPQQETDVFWSWGNPHHPWPFRNGYLQQTAKAHEKYALCALRDNGPRIWEIPTPVNCASVTRPSVHLLRVTADFFELNLPFKVVIRGLARTSHVTRVFAYLVPNVTEWGHCAPYPNVTAEGQNFFKIGSDCHFRGLMKLTDEIAQASSNRQRVCGLPSTVRSYYCNHVANTNQNLPAKYPTPRLLHMYATCARPPAFGRARTDLNFRQGSCGRLVLNFSEHDENR
jgi:hypothetical protein